MAIKELGDFVEKLFTLTSTVGELKSQLDRLNERLLNHHERIVRLETKLEGVSEVVLANAKVEYARTATEHHALLLQKIHTLEERIQKLEEMSISSDGQPDVKKLPQQISST